IDRPLLSARRRKRSRSATGTPRICTSVFLAVTRDDPSMHFACKESHRALWTFLCDPPLPRAHTPGRRSPLRLLLAGASAVPGVGHVLPTLAPFAGAARDAALGILAPGLLSSTQRPLRRRLPAPAIPLGS